MLPPVKRAVQRPRRAAPLPPIPPTPSSQTDQPADDTIGMMSILFSKFLILGNKFQIVVLNFLSEIFDGICFFFKLDIFHGQQAYFLDVLAIKT